MRSTLLAHGFVFRAGEPESESIATGGLGEPIGVYMPPACTASKLRPLVGIEGLGAFAGLSTAAGPVLMPVYAGTVYVFEGALIQRLTGARGVFRFELLDAVGALLPAPEHLDCFILHRRDD